MSTAYSTRRAKRAGQLPNLAPFFQPIASLARGRIAGFEALARFRTADGLLTPDIMLARLNRDDLLALFVEMVDHSLALTRQPWWPCAGIFVSVNVEAGLVLVDGFSEMLEHLLDAAGAAPGQLVIEILEGERIEQFDRVADVLERLRKVGLRIALDDLGSGYSSLTNLQQLPIDIIKLDRCFASNLQQRPKDLQFILALSGLARGLGKQFVVEGVETGDALDALTNIGADLAQGFAIGGPMAPNAVACWLAAYQRPVAHRIPCTLLGAYASHLATVEMLRLVPPSHSLQVGGREQADDWRECQVGRFLSQAGLHDTSYGQAYRRFHRAVCLSGTEQNGWEDASDEFRAALERAMQP